jgi:outer membrane protein
MKAMTWNGSKWMQTCAGCLAALAMATLTTSNASAQRISEARIRELIKQAAAQAATGQQPVAPATSQATPAATQPTVALTLDEAVKLALDRNLDIVVQRLNPEINDIAIASVKSVYHPSLTSTLATQAQTNPSVSTIAGNAAGKPVDSGLTTYNGGIAQNLPWGGGGFNIALNNNKTTTTSNSSLFNPAFNTNWSAAYTQPILRGFKTDSTRQQIQIAKINRDISDVQLRSTITNTLSNVRNAYWDYVFAIQSVDVAKQSVTLAEQLVKDNQTRVEVGTMAPIDVVQAQSQAATARQTLVQAQATMRTAELALKRLVVSGTQDVNWSATLDPVDRPDFVPETIDVQSAVRRALSERTDLNIARKDVQMNDVTLRFLRDQTLPQADLNANYGLVGLGGTQLIRNSGGGVTGPVTGTIPGGYVDALSALFGGSYPRWTITMSLSYPLGLSSAQASVARARVQLNQVQAQLKQIELQVATDVTNAAVTAQSNIERVQAAQAARELAQKQLDAENSKFEVGMSTNYNVVLAQRDLATAQNNELQAVLAYRKSLVELDRLQQTTLQSSGITVLSTGGLNNTATGSGRPTVVAGGGS